MKIHLIVTLLVCLSATSWGARSSFEEVDPGHSSEKFRQKIEAALDILDASESELGRATLESIRDGRVKIDEFGDFTREDFKELLKVLRDYQVGTKLTAKDFEDLQQPNSTVVKELETYIDGYIEEDRIYVAQKMATRKLALTLVHELNHVLNNSNANYDDPRDAFMEEYRAFYVEAMFEGKEVTDPRFRKRLKQKVFDLYGFDVDLSEIPDEPTGKLIPDRRAWQSIVPQN